MSVTRLRFGNEKKRVSQIRTGRVYAIAFDIDTQVAEKVIGENWKGCYEKIERVLTGHGFRRQQGSLYFGDETSNAVTCVTAIQDLDNRYPWFSRIVRDLRMLRIDEDNDLMPVLNNRLRFDSAANVA